MHKGQATYPELDEAVLNFIEKKRKEQKSVHLKMIMKCARRKFPKTYPDSGMISMYQVDGFTSFVFTTI